MAETGKTPDVLPSNLSSASSGWTHTEVKKFTYTWTIDNFSLYLHDLDSEIVSPKFTIGVTEGPFTYLVLRLRSPNNEDFVSIHLKTAVLIKSYARIQMDWFLICNEQEIFRKVNPSYCNFGNNCSFGYNKFIERNYLLDKSNGYFIDDKLTILCKGEIVSHLVNISGKNIGNPFNVPNCMALKNLERMLHEQKLSDVTFAIQGRELHVHKVILAAQSAVFAAMFEHEMVERNENRVEITDIDFQVFEAMIRFIYTGKAENYNRMADRLLMAADKYQLDRLKVICENELATSLSVDNAISIMILANLHNAYELKAVTIDFIVLRAHEFLETAKFKSLLQEYPLLGVETFQALADKRILETPRSNE